MKLFEEIIYTNNSKALKATDYLLVRAWEILCEKHTRKLSAEAIRVLVMVSNKTTVKTTSMVANQLLDPFDAFCDDRSLCYRDGDLFSFSLTFEGEVMKEKIIKELDKKHTQELLSIGSNKYIHPLAI